MDNVLHLFSTPLLNTYLNVSEEMFQFIKSQKFFRHGNGSMTNEYFLECPEMKFVKDSITNKVKSYLYDTCGISDKIIPELVTSWVNLHRKGDQAQIHIHTNSIVSGVWYISTPKNSGQLLVHCEKRLFGNFLEFPVEEINEFNGSFCSFTPHRGDLIIFPSDLRHSVHSNESDEERFSLAFNYMLRGDVRSGSGTTVKI